MDEKILSQLNTLLENASDSVRSVILDGHLDEAILVLINTYHLTVEESVSLKNTILLTLLGVIKPSDVRADLKKDLIIDEEALEALIKDIDTGIFEQARIALFGEEYEEGQEVKKLSLGEKESEDVLREQIMANTDRDSAIKTSPLEALKKKEADNKEKVVEEIVPLKELVKKGPTVQAPKEVVKEESKEKVEEKKDTSPVLPGSRSELLERLNILQSIPDSEQVSERMQSIRDQIAHMEEEKSAADKQADIDYALSSLKQKNADKNIFPTSYNIDPYREIPD